MVHVTVTTLSGTSETSTASEYVYEQAGPTVAGLSPASGYLGGGTVVTITGTNLNGATQVLFGTLPATTFTVNHADHRHGPRDDRARPGQRVGVHAVRLLAGERVHLPQREAPSGRPRPAGLGPARGHYQYQHPRRPLYRGDTGVLRKYAGRRLPGRVRYLHRGRGPAPGGGYRGRGRGHAERHLGGRAGRPVHLRCLRPFPREPEQLRRHDRGRHRRDPWHDRDYGGDGSLLRRYARLPVPDRFGLPDHHGGPCPRRRHGERHGRDPVRHLERDPVHLHGHERHAHGRAGQPGAGPHRRRQHYYHHGHQAPGRDADLFRKHGGPEHHGRQ